MPSRPSPKLGALGARNGPQDHSVSLRQTAPHPAKPDPHRFDDLFAAFGPVSLRRLFSGEGIYADGKIIGIVIRDVIYFKTDDESRAAFTAEGRKPFCFSKDGKRIPSSYYAIPERLYDDAEELAKWARNAESVSRAKSAVKKKRK